MLRSLPCYIRHRGQLVGLPSTSLCAVGCAGAAAGLSAAFSSTVSCSVAAPPAEDGSNLPVVYGPTTLASSNIVVFGGSSGIGKAIALGAAQQGATTVHIIGRNEDKLARAKAEIIEATGSGTTILTSSVDVTDEAAVKRFFEGIPEESVDHLVTTPGGSAKCGGVPDVPIHSAPAAQKENATYYPCLQSPLCFRDSAHSEGCVIPARPDQEWAHMRRRPAADGPQILRPARACARHRHEDQAGGIHHHDVG
eukprot:COSAG05_NODE_4606_length_1440_cov_1.674124_2_plen_252_part_00